MALSRSSTRLLGLVGAGLLLALPVYAQSKIAVVDTQRAIMETEEGLRMQATLKKVFDSRQRELDNKQQELAKERDDIEKQRDVLSKAALAKRVDKWQREMVQLQQVFVDYNKELQKKQGELTQPIFQKAMGLIRRVATQQGYDMVVDKQAVPYVRSDLDVTDQVITLYNQGATGEAAPAAPKSSGAPSLMPAPGGAPAPGLPKPKP
jgi:outer membrane protein